MLVLLTLVSAGIGSSASVMIWPCLWVWEPVTSLFGVPFITSADVEGL